MSPLTTLGNYGKTRIFKVKLMFLEPPLEHDTFEETLGFQLGNYKKTLQLKKPLSFEGKMITNKRGGS